jgi:hypothetical protein
VRFAVVLGFLTACKFSPPAGNTSDATGSDGVPDTTTPSSSCLEKWRAGTVTFGAPAKVEELSTSFVDVEPWISEDGLVMVFVREQSPGAGEILFSSRSSTTEAFGSVSPVALSQPTSDESKATLSPDFGFAVFASNLNVPQYQGETDLLSSTRTASADPDGSWPAPTNVMFSAVNTNGRDQDPFLIASGARLYLSVDPMGAPKSFLAMSERNGDVYGAPVKLFTSDHADHDPVLTEDEQVMVFSSTRPGGQGGRDLYFATRPTRTMMFGGATSLPALNTAQDEEDPALSADGCTLYFVSDRDDSLDIWSAAVL